MIEDILPVLGIRNIDDGSSKSFQIKASLGGIGIVTVEAVVFEKRFNAFGDSNLWLCIGLKPSKKETTGVIKNVNLLEVKIIGD